MPSHAEKLQSRVKGASAFNLTPTERANVERKSRNQHGTFYTFRDGSKVSIPNGTANVRILDTGNWWKRLKAMACRPSVIDFAPMVGDGIQAPGAIVLRKSRGAHPYVVHFYNAQDDAFYYGDYCATEHEGRRAFDQKCERYDRTKYLRNEYQRLYSMEG